MTESRLGQGESAMVWSGLNSTDGVLVDSGWYKTRNMEVGAKSSRKTDKTGRQKGWGLRQQWDWRVCLRGQTSVLHPEVREPRREGLLSQKHSQETKAMKVFYTTSVHQNTACCDAVAQWDQGQSYCLTEAAVLLHKVTGNREQQWVSCWGKLEVDAFLN